MRAGSGTRARYSSTLFAGSLRFAEEPRPPDFAFFISARLGSVTPAAERRLGGKVERRIPRRARAFSTASHAEVKHEGEEDGETNRGGYDR